MIECECGRPKPAGVDACEVCVAEEIVQGLRRARRASHGPRPEGETSAQYQQRRRAAKRAAGKCGMCYSRPADKPLETCEPCRARAKAQKEARSERGVCVSCRRPRRVGSTICEQHHLAALRRQRYLRGLATLPVCGYVEAEELTID